MNGHLLGFQNVEMTKVVLNARYLSGESTQGDTVERTSGDVVLDHLAQLCLQVVSKLKPLLLV